MGKEENFEIKISNQSIDEDEAYFNIDSRLLFQLGEQLVSSKAKALAELVKNSYDADATRAVISLINIKNSGGTITIEDNGIGISLDSFKKNWMRIATTDSSINPVSKKYKRNKSGEKGIGRIACRKIAEELKLETVYQNEKKEKRKLVAFFNWNAFKPGSDVDKVPVKYHVEIVDPLTPTGTILRLIKTIGNWTKANVDRLNTELSELYSPMLFESDSGKDVPYSLTQHDVNCSETNDPGFIYEIITDEFPKFKESLNKAFFKTAWAKLTGTVDENGKAIYNLKVQNRVVSSFEKELIKEENFKQLKNARTEIYFFIYKGTNFYYDTPWSSREAGEIGKNHGGIRIYADYFRIFGYGDPGDDWLDLASERARSLTKFYDETDKLGDEGVRYGLSLFPNTRLFGYVNYEKKSNPDIQISITREKLDTTDTFTELKSFVRLGINFATVLYANEVAKKKKAEQERKEKAEEEKRAREEAIRKELEQKKKESENEIEKAEEELKEIEVKFSKIQQSKIEIQSTISDLKNQNNDLQKQIRDLELRANSSNSKSLWLKIEDEKKKTDDLLNSEKIIEEKEKELTIYENSLKEKIEDTKNRILELKGTLLDNTIKSEEEKARINQAEIESKERKLREEIATFRILASTGTSVFIFIHEIQSLIEDMIVIQDDYEEILANLDSNNKLKYSENFDRFTKRIEMVDEFGEFLGLTIGKESRSQVKNWHLKEIVSQVFTPFKLDLKEKGIEYSIAISPTIRSPPMYRSEIFAIFLNFLTNSIKALKSSSTRNIEVQVFENEDEELIIHFLDTGRGLDKDDWDLVFDPFVTSGESDLRYGTGTGLGLKLVKDIIDNYKGEINFIESPKGWNTCIEVRLPLV